jgi:hypothetical protein
MRANRLDGVIRKGLPSSTNPGSKGFCCAAALRPSISLLVRNRVSADSTDLWAKCNLRAANISQDGCAGLRQENPNCNPEATIREAFDSHDLRHLLGVT